jgi:hypothetical protein
MVKPPPVRNERRSKDRVVVRAPWIKSPLEDSIYLAKLSLPAAPRTRTAEFHRVGISGVRNALGAVEMVVCDQYPE